MALSVRPIHGCRPISARLRSSLAKMQSWMLAMPPVPMPEMSLWMPMALIGRWQGTLKPAPGLTWTVVSPAATLPSQLMHVPGSPEIFSVCCSASTTSRTTSPSLHPIMAGPKRKPGPTCSIRWLIRSRRMLVPQIPMHSSKHPPTSAN